MRVKKTTQTVLARRKREVFFRFAEIKILTSTRLVYVAARDRKDCTHDARSQGSSARRRKNSSSGNWTRIGMYPSSTVLFLTFYYRSHNNRWCNSCLLCSRVRGYVNCWRFSVVDAAAAAPALPLALAAELSITRARRKTTALAQKRYRCTGKTPLSSETRRSVIIKSHCTE